VEKIKTDLLAADTMLVGQSVAQAELQLLAVLLLLLPLDSPALQRTQTTYSLQI